YRVLGWIAALAVVALLLLPRLGGGADGPTAAVLGQPPRQKALAEASLSSPLAPTSPPPDRLLALPPPAITSASAIVMDDASGAVLFESRSHDRLPPASVTKIATAVVAIRDGNLDDWV